ncbi:DAK2 domain-containing protein [Nocardioides daejeonensis]|uniref:DAK2 domain-containing protein n=1 Tax=Nocardioides daejeonensis TaxID=1046556 RepID=UPI001EF46631|nr:DAK2 domain-containing protein [Nocardioides daejeonensis]
MVDQASSQAPSDVATLLRFIEVATGALAAAREEIDALNVYPVPDGDTGTNMFLTLSAARDALHQAVDQSVEETAENRASAFAAFARGALLGARGNSGVILSQMLGAMTKHIAGRLPGERSVDRWADAMVQATAASYEAVGTPVEGTILSVARAGSEAARAAADALPPEQDDVAVVVAAAAGAAHEALLRTPSQLQVLADAGVVDAGGRGLCVLLDALETALTGRRAIHDPGGPVRRHIPVPLPTHDLTAEGPAYEVMYLLDAEDAVIPELRRRLAALGDSLVVVGGEGLWNVHVHVDDVGAAIEVGIESGRPHRVRVTHFAEQVSGRSSASTPSARRGRVVVAVSAGDGLSAIFGEAGAVVVSGGPGRRPSAGMLLEAIRESGAAEAIVLPNDPDTVRSAEIAVRSAEVELGVRAAVIPSLAQVQGLAALAVHEPGRSFDQDVLHMTATASHARHGAVTVAAKQAITMAGPCEPGDVLGVIAGDFAIVGTELADVATRIIDRLLGGGGELVTLVAGVGGEELSAHCAGWVESQHATVDVVVYDGGQERYPLLIAVE